MTPFFGTNNERDGTPELTAAVEALGAELADGAGEAPALEEIVGRFVEATPRLTALERADLLRAIVEDVESGTVPRGPTSSAPRPASAGARPSGPPARSPGKPRGKSGGFNWGKLASGFRTGLDVFQQAAQVVSQFSPQPAPAAPGSAPGAAPSPPPGGAAAAYATPQPSNAPSPYPPPSYAPPSATPGVARRGTLDALGSAILQGLRSGQLQSLPRPGGPASAAPLPPSAPPSLDATATLGLLLADPQLRQAMQWAAVLGPRAPRSVQLQVPSTTDPGSTRSVGLPLGAIMNAIARLATEAVAELEGAAGEDDPEVPEYLVGEDGAFVVDVASPEERARAATFMLRLAQEAERARRLDGAGAENELDAWAREAGWT